MSLPRRCSRYSAALPASLLAALVLATYLTTAPESAVLLRGGPGTSRSFLPTSTTASAGRVDDFDVSALLPQGYDALHATLELPSADAASWLPYDAARMAFLMDFRRWLASYEALARPARLLVDSATDLEIPLMAPAYMCACAFDGTARCDYHVMTMTEGGFTAALLSQVVEHLYDPLLAFHVVRSHLTTGGYLILSMPTFNKPHMEPSHYQHFTLRGLALSLRRVGFEVVEAGFFGCRAWMEAVFLHGIWPPYPICAPPQVNGDSPAQMWLLARRIELPGEAALPAGAPSSGHNFSCSLQRRPLYTLAEAAAAHALINPKNPAHSYTDDAVAVAALQKAVPQIGAVDAAVAAVALAAAGLLAELAQNRQAVARIVMDAEHHAVTAAVLRAVASGATVELWHTRRHTSAKLPSQLCDSGGEPAAALASGWSAAATAVRTIEVHIIGPALHFTIDVHTLLLAAVHEARAAAASRGRGAVFMLSCRVLDVLQGLTDDALWFCTPQGLVVYAQRAGLRVVRGSWWGTEAYARDLIRNKRQQIFAEALADETAGTSTDTWVAAATAWLVAE